MPEARRCPKCSGKAPLKTFQNEFGKFAKLWVCEGCSAALGVPEWDMVAREPSHDWGLESWTEGRLPRTDRTSPILPGFKPSEPANVTRPFIISALVVSVIVAEFLLHLLS